MEWLYSGLAGIKQQAGDFGFKQIEIEPEIINGLDWVKGNYKSINGDIKVHCVKTGKQNKLTVSIPANTSAKIVLPVSDLGAIMEGGKKIVSNKYIKFAGKKGNKVILDVESGDYIFNF